MPRRPKVHRTADPAQIEALASPIRHEVINTFEAVGEASVADIAEMLGRSTHSLHYHIRKLVEVGLLQKVRERPAGPRRTETVYRTLAPEIRLKPDWDNPDNLASIARAISSALRLADRDFTASLYANTAPAKGKQRSTFGGRHKAWFTPEEQAEANDLIDRLFKLGTHGTPPENARLLIFTVTMCHKEG